MKLASKKGLYDMKLGEETTNKDLLMGILKSPARLVKITYTLQDKDGITCDASLIHKSYVEEEEVSK